MLWLIVLAEAIPVALLGIVVVVLAIRHNTRISNLEWLLTERLDTIIEARNEQKAAEEVARLYGLHGKAPTSRPVAFSISTPPADPWAHNGYNG